MNTALSYLEKARTELLAERAGIDREIAVLDEVIGRLQKTPSSPGPQVITDVADLPSAARSIKDITLDIASRGEVFALSEVVEAAKLEGSPAKYESISSVVSRLGSEGVLNRGPRRGTYVLRKHESPDLSGDSATQTDTSVTADGPSTEGGGVDDVDPADLLHHPPIVGAD